MELTLNEIGLARALANSLVIPMFIVDPEGNMLYYNKPAENMLGQRFSETGPMSSAVWSRLFIPTDEGGTPIDPDSLPLMITLQERRPAHNRFWIKGLDNVARHIEVTSFPLLTPSNNYLGAVAMFWDAR